MTIRQLLYDRGRLRKVHLFRVVFQTRLHLWSTAVAVSYCGHVKSKWLMSHPHFCNVSMRGNSVNWCQIVNIVKRSLRLFSRNWWIVVLLRLRQSLLRSITIDVSKKKSRCRFDVPRACGLTISWSVPTNVLHAFATTSVWKLVSF